MRMEDADVFTTEYLRRASQDAEKCVLGLRDHVGSDALHPQPLSQRTLVKRQRHDTEPRILMQITQQIEDHYLSASPQIPREDMADGRTTIPAGIRVCCSACHRGEAHPGVQDDTDEIAARHARSLIGCPQYARIRLAIGLRRPLAGPSTGAVGGNPRKHLARYRCRLYCRPVRV